MHCLLECGALCICILGSATLNVDAYQEERPHIDVFVTCRKCTAGPLMFDNTDQEIETIIRKAKRSSERCGWLSGLFRRPDHQRSAELYSEAGHRLKYLGRNKEAADCYISSGDEYIASKCCGYLFFAAEAYSNSYALSSDKKVLVKACELYCMNNSYSLAANCRKQLLKEEVGEEALRSLDFLIMCYEKAGMKMHRMNQVEQKGILCIGLRRYREAGECFRECGKMLHAFLAYFLDGNEKKMRELEFEHEIAESFYGRDRAKHAREAVTRYIEYNSVREEYSALFEAVLERLRPEHDIL